MHNATKLRDLLHRSGIVTVVAAHDALSAKLVQEAGFDAIWASGFGISAALKCIPDASFVTLTEQLDVERNMVEAVGIPIIADCDTGYGNALNVMRTVTDHGRAGIAAICIEDNVFPKRCSFYAGVRRELVPIDEHCGKIKAAKAAQTVPDFMVIARTEALIAGWGQEEALKRAEAYAKAGADAVLIHSKSPTFDELKTVARKWSGRVPLVVVPTIFDGVTATELQEAGFKIVIYANQVIRAGIKAMRDALAVIKQDTRPGAVNDRIVKLNEVDELVGVPEMKGRCLFLYGDIIFDVAVLQKLLKSPADVSLVVDLAWYDQRQRGLPNLPTKPDLVMLQTPPGASYLSRYVLPEEENRVLKIGQDLPHDLAHGEFIGLAMFSDKGIEAFKRAYREARKTYEAKGFHEAGTFLRASFSDMLQELIDTGHTVSSVPIFKGWVEVDSFEEYQQAWAKIRQ